MTDAKKQKMNLQESEVYNAVNELVGNHCSLAGFTELYRVDLAHDAMNKFIELRPGHWFKAPFNDEHIAQYLSIIKHQAGKGINLKEHVLVWKRLPILREIDKLDLGGSILCITSYFALINKNYLCSVQ